MLYAVINRYVKDWWYYKELRAGGHTEKARAMERMTIKTVVKLTRGALESRGHILLTEDWFALVLCPGRVISGTNVGLWYAVGRTVGIPIIDMRPVPEPSIRPDDACQDLSYFRERGAVILT